MPTNTEFSNLQQYPIKFILCGLVNLILHLLHVIFSFEAVLVLFMFAGIYKADSRFAIIPIDLTGLLFTLSVIIAFYIIVFKIGIEHYRLSRNSLVLLLFGLSFVSYSSISLLWSPGYLYAKQKAFYLGTLTFWSFVGAVLIISRSLKRVGRFFLSYFYFLAG